MPSRAPSQGADATLALWLRGLQALQTVHARGEVLSQAVARNMVVCPDGEIGFIDFEDDPASHLPHAVCMARDALNYAQSTALFCSRPAPWLLRSGTGQPLYSNCPMMPGRCCKARSKS